VEYFNYLNIVITNYAIKSRIATTTAAFNKMKALFASKFDANVSKKLVLKCQLCVVLKLGHLRKYIRNTWKVSKCGAGEGWRSISWTDLVRNYEILHRHKRRGISYIQKKEGRLTVLVTSCVGTAF
jgi:hypothetical protein